jgi:hypothetical protein
MTHSRFDCTSASIVPAACLVAALLATGGCATSDNTDQPTQKERLAEIGYAIEREVDSIPNYQVSSWRYLDPQGVILKGGPSRRYLVRLTQRCTELRWTETLGTTSTINRLTRFDRVLARRPGGGIPRRCGIERLFLLERVDGSQEKGESNEGVQ